MLLNILLRSLYRKNLTIIGIGRGFSPGCLRLAYSVASLYVVRCNIYTANSWFSLWEKNTQNEHIIAHFEYFFTCHYNKTVWLAENLSEIKITHYEKTFSHIKAIFSQFEKRLGIKHIFLSRWDYHYFHRDTSHYQL